MTKLFTSVQFLNCNTRMCVTIKQKIKALKKKKIVKAKTEAAAYHKLLSKRIQEAKERRSESLAKRRARSQSQASDA